MPGFAGRCRQLTEARQAAAWLAAGSVIVQQQAIRDHGQAMRNFFAGTHRLPSWRKAGRDEGFRVVHLGPGDVRRLNRHWAQVRIPKAGVGAVPLVSSGARGCEVIAGDPRPRGPVAWRVRCDPAPGARSG
jgi:hypothetical protein